MVLFLVMMSCFRPTFDIMNTPLCSLLHRRLYLTMHSALAPALVITFFVACLASTVSAFALVGGGSAFRSCVVGRSALESPSQQEWATCAQQKASRHQQRHRRSGVQSLRASSGDEDGGGGFPNPYLAFRKWQMDLIESKAKGNKKYPEAYEGLMKEPGMTPSKAERLAKLSVSDPILYAIERRREANEINKTPMDYDKISGFFPMEWILSGDFGWGFNKKKKRLAEEATDEK